LAGLKTLGVRIAVEDFGNGESSFSYLRRLPISVLKVDKLYILSMLESAADEALVRPAIELGHNLGLRVVAEGVETEEAKVLFEQLGCDRLQGFHLGRPEASSLHTVGLPGLPHPRVA
jgi:EAL domain-containing protein (putative c-di-GMP-specific phosphodiesterase class I)